MKEWGKGTKGKKKDRTLVVSVADDGGGFYRNNQTLKIWQPCKKTMSGFLVYDWRRGGGV